MIPRLERTLVLGIGHKARQGKDTIVRLLMAAYPGRIFRVSMADALKAHARVVHGMTKKDAPLLQRVGVAERERDPDVWVRAAAWAIAELDADAVEPIVVVVPDVRFENEAAFVRDAGGVLARVRRLDAEGRPVVATDRPADHPSETALDAYPWPHTLEHRPGEHLDGGRLQAAAVALVEGHLRKCVDLRTGQIVDCP